MRIALIQMAVTDGDVTANLVKAEKFVRQVVAEQPAGKPLDVVLLPELWTTGYAYDMWHSVASERTPSVAQWLTALSTELGVSIGGSMVTQRDDGALVNRFSLTVPGGQSPVTYDKSHLFAPMREIELLAPGTSAVHTSIAATQAGLSICYDLRFPKMYRASACGGTEIFLVVSAWPEPRCTILRTLATARAVENQAFLALCNRAGPAADGTCFCGGSMVVSPTGEILLDLGHEEGVGVVEVRTREVKALRAMLKVLDGEIAGVDY
jgi:predicted amidohydrolase